MKTQVKATIPPGTYTDKELAKKIRELQEKYVVVHHAPMIFGSGNRIVDGEPAAPVENACTCTPRCAYSCMCNCHDKPKHKGYEWL